MSRVAKIALLAGVLALITLAGGASFIVSQTKVSPDAIRSSVTRSEAGVEKAWKLPAASTFKRELTWQSNPSLCGPASIANALRSLGETATSENLVLAGTGRCWTGICFMGLTLDELAEITRLKTKRTVTVLRDLSPDQFQQHLRRANETGRRYIINFSRKEIFGAGTGHHSPIGGYLEAEDMVFVLDVNRDYQPWLIARARLFAAMDTWDGEKKRGLLLIE
jgi:NAD-dependent oxidoreductase involved in siderophore biosynthesis